MKQKLISTAIQQLLVEEKPADPPIDLTEKKWKKVDGYCRYDWPYTKPLKVYCNGMLLQTASIGLANLERLWFKRLMGLRFRRPIMAVPAKRRFIID